MQYFFSLYHSEVNAWWLCSIYSSEVSWSELKLCYDGLMVYRYHGLHALTHVFIESTDHCRLAGVLTNSEGVTLSYSRNINVIRHIGRAWSDGRNKDVTLRFITFRTCMNFVKMWWFLKIVKTGYFDLQSPLGNLICDISVFTTTFNNWQWNWVKIWWS